MRYDVEQGEIYAAVIKNCGIIQEDFSGSLTYNEVEQAALYYINQLSFNVQRCTLTQDIPEDHFTLNGKN